MTYLHSGGWGRIGSKRPFPDCYREHGFCYARDENRLLSGCGGELLSVKNGWGVGNLPCTDIRSSVRSSGVVGSISRRVSNTSADVLILSEHGFATHFVPARRIPMLLDQLAELHKPHASLIDKTIENFAAERETAEPPAPFTGATRIALDSAFRHNEVEHIVEDLEMFSHTSANASVKQWASDALEMLHMRSPTSLKVALTAIRRGKKLTLLETLNMELKIATAFCVSFIPFFI
jgi:3-hydroxyisobutyryl-CoA hydrolase